MHKQHTFSDQKKTCCASQYETIFEMRVNAYRKFRRFEKYSVVKNIQARIHVVRGPSVCKFESLQLNISFSEIYVVSSQIQ